ncbi:diaminopimelate epimerase [Salinigranum rubrum]|uniref:Diaminopimelate epimerase n=1 Tax=Salinigranum rubrum TaxID=755307 RepID=A0A2I8VHQ8_9EURY|nr:diaminopimelate epimerase [Salinigranum rubrum]AUV81445.1 diaminopimelate epimerase [Salinigranum rubrum]
MTHHRQTVPFEKYHGTGNDFVVVDADYPVPNRPVFATTYCDRTTGVVDSSSETVGADGVLFLALESSYDPPRVVMTLVQPDGSVAAMCGNGARCAAAWARNRTGADVVMIDTPAGTRRAVLDGDEVTVEMGVPSFEPRDVPLARDEPLVEERVEGLTVTAVDTGVPHAVAFVESVDDVDLESVAPPIRHADLFPRGTNVTVASETEDGFRQRTFERGVEGETRSCGTGAVAVVAVAKRLGLVGDEEVRVSPPGGDLMIRVPDREEATLRGPVVRDFEGELETVPTPEP